MNRIAHYSARAGLAWIGLATVLFLAGCGASLFLPHPLPLRRRPSEPP